MNVEAIFPHPSDILWKKTELLKLNEVRKGLDLKGPILDVGCGEGKLALLLFGQNGVDVGVDIDPQNAENAKESGAYQKVFCADAQNLSFPDNHFKTIFSAATLHLIPDLDKTLKELSRLLDEGGLLIFTVPSDHFSENLLFAKIFPAYVRYRNQKLKNIYLLSPAEWETRLAKFGLTLVESRYYLSPSATKLWDLMAFVLFFLGPFKKLAACAFKPLVRKYSCEETEFGGGLLLVVKKQ